MFVDTIRKRFEAKVDRSAGAEGCWPWLAGRGRDGYGHFKLAGKQHQAHRIAFALAYGVSPNKKLVCHTCDNPPCCNPKHLWLGTAADNMRDAKSKGRMCAGDKFWARTHPEKLARGARHGSKTKPQSVRRGATHYYKARPELKPKGEKNGRAKLDAHAVHAIRQANSTQAELAVLYGVSKSTIQAIRARRLWSHLNEVCTCE